MLEKAKCRNPYFLPSFATGTNTHNFGFFTCSYRLMACFFSRSRSNCLADEILMPNLDDNSFGVMYRILGMAFSMLSWTSFVMNKSRFVIVIWRDLPKAGDSFTVFDSGKARDRKLVIGGMHKKSGIALKDCNKNLNPLTRVVTKRNRSPVTRTSTTRR